MVFFCCFCRRDLNTRRPPVSLPVVRLNLSAPLHAPKFVILATVDPTLVFFYTGILRATQFLPLPRSSARNKFLVYRLIPAVPLRLVRSVVWPYPDFVFSTNHIDASELRDHLSVVYRELRYRCRLLSRPQFVVLAHGTLRAT